MKLSTQQKVFLLVGSIAYTPTLKMQAVDPSQMSVNYYQTTRYYIPESIIHGFNALVVNLFLLMQIVY
jgi:hypothetical protein